MFGARFDDATTGESFVLTEPREELVAKTIDDVRVVIERASAAAAEGYWVAGYVSYEAAPAFDPALSVRALPHEPLAWFGVFGGCDAEPPAMSAGDSASYALSSWTPSMKQAEYREAFEAVRAHIRHGDTYQVNLTFGLSAAFNGDAEALYTDLLNAQRPAYGSHIWHGTRHVLSTSPERFFSIEGTRIVTTPMKGTARRGRWPQEDDEARSLLEASAKDRAENLMIVDLIRNDLGRIAAFGTVSVDDLFRVGMFPTVWQMTSTISAEIAPDISLVDTFSALFPCGSVTGAPKASSMAVIRDVENGPRGVYCGAVGFIPPGDGLSGASFNVAIRTVVIDDDDGIANYGVGGGVTWYSDVDDEYREAVTKSLALRRHEPVSGLFETVRWDPDGGWVLLDEHLDRLAASAAFFGIPIDIHSAREALHGAVEGRAEPTRVRLTIGEGGADVSVAEAPATFYRSAGVATDAVALVIDLDPIDTTDPSLFHKTTNRKRYSVRSARHSDADDVVLVNEAGLITETTIANIAILVGDTWVTPPATDGLLAGVLRNALVADGALVEGSITVDDLRQAPAIARINSVRGWQAAVLIPG